MTSRPVLFTALASALALSAAAAPPPGAGPLETASEVRAAWLGLPGSTNGCREHYDYFPEGGLAIFYCHARSLLSVERLEQLAGFPSTRTPQPGTPTPTPPRPTILILVVDRQQALILQWLRNAQVSVELALRSPTDFIPSYPTDAVHYQYILTTYAIGNPPKTDTIIQHPAPVPGQ